MSDVELLVCIKCRRDLPTDVEGPRPGAKLHEALDGRLPDGVTLKAVECLSNCSRGCSIVLRGPDRWSFVYGNLHEDTAADIVVEGATKYHAAPDGLVPWRERPEHFRKNCIARIPPVGET